MDPEKAIEIAERDRKIIELRRNGTHWRDIADVVGLSMTRCHQIFEAYRKNIPQHVADAWREEELDLLGRGIKDLLVIAEDPDVAPRTRAEAWKEIRQHCESRRKMLGTDAPMKREIEWIDSSSFDAKIQAEIEDMERAARAAEILGSNR